VRSRLFLLALVGFFPSTALLTQESAKDWVIERRESLLKYEKDHIEKIRRFSDQERSTILFTVGGDVVGYARQGVLTWVDSGARPPMCGWPHPSLSHDGTRIAFVSSSPTPRKCLIVIYDIRSRERRTLIETSDDPGEISWSWDDTEVAFLDQGIHSINVTSGNKRELLSVAKRTIGGRRFTSWVWFPMQWLHNNKDLVIELQTEVALKEPGSHWYQSNILFVKSGDPTLFGPGSDPVVAPDGDRFAYYAEAGVMVTQVNGKETRVLSPPPRSLLFFQEDLAGPIVWSPDASRLFFGTVVSENRSDKVYLLNVRSGKGETFLTKTSIAIRGWH